MKFDKLFYIQKNSDGSGNLVRLDDSENCRMKGTEKNPVRIIGEIDALEVDHDIFGTLFESPDKITLKLIVTRLHPYGLMSYYMRFIFYDFSKMVHLFLFNAKVIKINEILLPENRQQYSLEITSTKNAECPACRVFGIKHGAI